MIAKFFARFKPDWRLVKCVFLHVKYERAWYRSKRSTKVYMQCTKCGRNWVIED